MSGEWSAIWNGDNHYVESLSIDWELGIDKVGWNNRYWKWEWIWVLKEIEEEIDYINKNIELELADL